MGVCLLLCFLIKDKGLTRPEEKPQIQETSCIEAGIGESDLEMQVQEGSKKESKAEGRHKTDGDKNPSHDTMGLP